MLLQFYTNLKKTEHTHIVFVTLYYFTYHLNIQGSAEVTPA